MRIVPLSLKKANEFVDKHHRHNKHVVTHKVSIGMEIEGKLIGVAIGGHPVARALDNGKTFEIRRVCVLDGYANACSKLLARMKRIAQLMGYEKVITYTLKKESGSSLKAVGARCVAEVKPSQGWTRRNPHCEHQAVYDEWKYRWELQDQGGKHDPSQN